MPRFPTPDLTLPDDAAAMQHAIAVARRGLGAVEPNPMVGAVLVGADRRVIAEGWHEHYGGPHAEVMALRRAGGAAEGATLYVSLEPCNHHGKTPPCTEAVIQSGVQRIVIGTTDPAPHNEGLGLERLSQAGLQVEVGVCREDADALIAPFATLSTLDRPYVLAKWAMTLDGKLATRTGASKWISSPQSRIIVHQLRGRMDGILVGMGTVLADDPELTARPAGPRTPLRIILDSHGKLPPGSRLAATLDAAPLLIVSRSDVQVPNEHRKLESAGAELFRCPPSASGTGIDLESLMKELGKRQMTNLLVEGGSRVLGAFRDQNLIDEVHCFLAPKLVGGEQATTPVGGHGLETMPQQSSLLDPKIELIGSDVYIHGRVNRDTV